MWLKVFEIICSLILLIFFITQLVIPAWQGRQLFPLFRKQGKLESEFANAVQDRHNTEIVEATELMRELDLDCLSEKGDVWYYEKDKRKGRGATAHAAYRDWLTQKGKKE